MKFNTQVCTTREQSERLLALGLKKEAADCHHWYADGKWYTYIGEPNEFNCVPAWSLGRLIAIGESSLTINSNGRTVVANDYSCFDNHENLFDNIIDWLDWLNKRNILYSDY